MRFRDIFRGSLIFAIIIASFCSKSYAQSYGLSFYSQQEVVQDKRTGLDLSPGKSLCFKDNFDLSFDIGFFPGQRNYFGYILRVIEDDKRNIDLVYEWGEFKLITREGGSIISFKIDKDELFKHWNKISLKFDLDHGRLVLYAGSQTFMENKFNLKAGSCYKILFGANNYKQYQTSDVLPMKIRNIRITAGNVLKYNWPLNEAAGATAHEVIAQNNAAVTYPKWGIEQHSKWLKVRSFTVTGMASVAYDAVKENVYVAGDDSLFNYSIQPDLLNRMSYNIGKQQLNLGNQSIFSNCDGNLYSFYLDKQFISIYDFKTRSLDRLSTEKKSTFFFHANKFLSCTDTSLYVLGGYGHHLYKNTVKQYHIKSHTWQDITVKGDFFTPRYLAGLGTNSQGDTAYILGGYGSTRGKQILTPLHLYDMMRFTVKDKTFKKLFDLQVKGEDFVFANSLLIDSKAKTYYGLVVPNHKYNTILQLISGSLTGPEYKLVGDTIPYLFADNTAFADLYFSPSTNKFVAVTLLRLENNTTRVNIFTLLGPPYVSGSEPIIGTEIKSYTWYILAAIFILAITTFYAFKFRKYFHAKRQQPTPILVTNSVVENKGSDTPSFTVAETRPYQESCLKSTILLFGDLQVFDAEGVPFIKLFSPLLKELFLIILLYSIRWDRGVSTEKLNELFWFDKDHKSARNNRAVNIAKLKTLLDKIGHCQVSNETGYWKLDIDFSSINIDYYNYLKIIEDKKGLNKDRIRQLTQITQGRNFLSNVEYEWLDAFKSEISNEVIDTYLHFANKIDKTEDSEFMVELANFIFYFDPVNEDAMVLKCKALFGLGKHSLAKNTYERFVKEYKSIYNVEFKKDFNSILG
jgi:DNA-binding SARP family transcriptional activator